MANPRVKYTPEQREALNALLDKANAGGGFIETWQEAKEKHAYQGSDKTWYQNAYRRKTEGQKKTKGEAADATAKPAKSAKSAKKRRGKRSRRGYDDAVKAAIVNAVLAARKSGESWRKAHGAAEEAGYKGTLGGLVQFIRQNVKGGAKKGIAAAKPAKAKRGRGRGRPKGSATKAPATHSVGLEGVLAAYIDSRVRAQVAAQVEEQVHTAVQGALRGLLGNVK